MSATVWKYALPDVDVTLSIPENARVIHVAEQHGQICLWVHLDPSQPDVRRRFYVVGTGHPIPSHESMPPLHVGSLLVQGGDFVFHVFESLDVRLNVDIPGGGA